MLLQKKLREDASNRPHVGWCGYSVHPRRISVRGYSRPKYWSSARAQGFLEGTRFQSRLLWECRMYQQEDFEVWGRDANCFWNDWTQHHTRAGKEMTESYQLEEEWRRSPYMPWDHGQRAQDQYISFPSQWSNPSFAQSLGCESSLRAEISLIAEEVMPDRYEKGNRVSKHWKVSFFGFHEFTFSDLVPVCCLCKRI